MYICVDCSCYKEFQLINDRIKPFSLVDLMYDYSRCGQFRMIIVFISLNIYFRGNQFHLFILRFYFEMMVPLDH